MGRTEAASAILDRDSVNVVTKMTVQVSDECLQKLPLGLRFPGMNLGHDDPTFGDVPGDPTVIGRVDPPSRFLSN